MRNPRAQRKGHTMQSPRADVDLTQLESAQIVSDIYAPLFLNAVYVLFPVHCVSFSLLLFSAVC